MTEKVTGYSLIVVGLLIIAYAGFSVFSVFTARAEAIELFQFKGVSIPLSALMEGGAPPGVELPEIEIFPAEVLNSTTNTLFYLLFMGFLVTVGAKVATLGINLVRPIIVKVEGKRIDGIEKPA